MDFNDCLAIRPPYDRKSMPPPYILGPQKLGPDTTTATPTAVVTDLQSKEPSEPKQKLRPSSMSPSLHQDVSKAVSAAQTRLRWVDAKVDHKDFNNQYSTNVMGKFTCNKDGCPALV